MALPNLPIKTGHVFIGIAIMMGLMTMFLFGGKKPEKPKAAPKIVTQSVVVPISPISEGKTLTMNDVTTVKWPSEFLPKGSLFGDPYQVVGRVAKQDLFPGEPIFVEKLSGSNTSGGLPAIIPKGMRAVTVAVTEVKGVAGFVKPGDRVDVLTTFELEKSEGQDEKVRTTKTVLQNVLVLASAQTMVNDNKYEIETPDGVTRGEASPVAEPEKTAKKEPEKEKDQKKKDAEREKEAKQREKEKKEAEKAARLVSSVTLALSPAQTETLALAEETGDIRLALRPETDHGIAKLNGVNFDALLGDDKPAPRIKTSVSGKMPTPPQIPAASRPVGTQVEFIQGSDKTLFSF